MRADIFLRAAGPATAGINPPIATSVPAIVAATPGVAETDTLRAFEFRYEGTRAMFAATNIDTVRQHRALRFLSGTFPGLNQAMITEPFSDKHHLHTGDVLHIPLGGRVADIAVSGVYYDYSSDRGTVLVDRPRCCSICRLSRSPILPSMCSRARTRAKCGAIWKTGCAIIR